MADGTYNLYVDWNNDGDFSDSDENVTTRLLHLEWSRGRDRGSQLTGKSISSRLTAVLDNQSGDYSSFNTGSDIYGNLKPGRRVRLTAVANDSFTYTFPFLFSGTSQFNGYLESIKPIARQSGAHQVVLEATGPMGQFGGNEVSHAHQTSVRTGTAMKAILDAQSIPTDDSHFDAGQTTMTRFWLDRAKLLVGIRQIENTEGGFILENKDGEIAFEDRHHRMTNDEHTASAATWSDASGAEIGYSAISQADPNQFIYNDFEAVVQLYTVGDLAVLWTLPETGSASPLLFPSEVRVYWATYPTPDSANNATGVDAWTTSASTTDYTGNTASDGSGTNRTASLGVAVVKTGGRMQITLTNNHATDPVYLTKLQARGTPITKDHTINVNAEDTTSQTDFGKRTWPSKAGSIPTSAEAVDWANYNLSIYKDPVPYIKAQIIANRNATTLHQVLRREISDRITLVATNSAGLGINEDFYIEKESHLVSQSGKAHQATFDLSPATAFGGFWALDLNQLGLATRLAY